MNPKHLYVHLLTLGFMLLGFNMALKYLGRNSPPRQLLRQIDASTPPDVVFLGNSLMACAIDLNALRQQHGKNLHPLRPLNISLGASDTVQHLLLMRRAIARKPRMRVCVYGFFDFQLTDEPKPEMAGNGTFSYYTEPGVATQYYKLAWLQKQMFFVAGKVPYLMERGTVFQKVELARRRLSAVGMPPVQNNRFGRAGDFTLLEAASQSNFDARGSQAVLQNTGLTKPVQALITLMHGHADRVVIVEMPMPLRHLNLFYKRPAWAAYRAHLRKMVTQMGAEYVQASEWVPGEDCFADNLHMNTAGAKVFSRRIAKLLW